MGETETASCCRPSALGGNGRLRRACVDLSSQPPDNLDDETRTEVCQIR